jgi:hypothetical protein
VIAVVMNNAINVNPHLNPPPRVGEETIFFFPSRGEELFVGAKFHIRFPLDGGRLKMGVINI